VSDEGCAGDEHRHAQRAGRRQRRDDPHDQVGLFEQEGAVVAAPCDRLRAAAVEVDRVALALCERRGGEQRRGIVAAELRHERPFL